MIKYNFIKIIFFTLLLLFLNNKYVFSQKGGLPSYPVLSKSSAIKQGYVMVNNTDSLLKYVSIPNSKIYISGSFSLTKRISINANDITIQSNRSYVISSNLFFSTPFRFFESFAIEANNVTIQGLILRGSDPDVRTVDTILYQTGIRCHAKNFKLINCELSDWGWAALYFHSFDSAFVDQCYFHRNKNNGYGYGTWFEGKGGQKVIVQNCYYEDNRESTDAGGQLNVWEVRGCVFENGVTSHRNGINRAAVGVNVFYNTFIGKISVGSFTPSTDTGWINISNNYFEGDSNSIFVRDENPNPLATYTYENNHFNGEGINKPIMSLIIDSIVIDKVYFQIVSTDKKFEVSYGNGTVPFLTTSKKINKIYTSGSYTISARSIGTSGIRSEWQRKKVVISKIKGISFGIKTTARFQPKSGYYNVQCIIDDTIRWQRDATQIWKWNRIIVPFNAIGKHTVCIKLNCIKDTYNPIIMWLDDFDVNGKVANSDFEYEPMYKVPYSLWRQTFSKIEGGISSIGSGIDFRERCSGKNCWRFEMRPSKQDSVICKEGTYAILYQQIVF